MSAPTKTLVRAPPGLENALDEKIDREADAAALALIRKWLEHVHAVVEPRVEKLYSYEPKQLSFIYNHNRDRETQPLIPTLTLNELLRLPYAWFYFDETMPSRYCVLASNE